MARIDSEQRARILEAAICVFALRGLEGATIRAVGEKAGLASALLYYYFENKQTLFVEATGHIVRGLLEHLESRRREFDGARDRITFLVEGVFSYYGSHPERIRMMGIVHTQYEEILGRVVEEEFKKAVPLPFRVLREGQERGEIRPMHPAQMWWSMMGACVFSLFMHRVFEHLTPGTLPVAPPSLEESREQIIDMFAGGLAVAPGKSKTS